MTTADPLPAPVLNEADAARYIAMSRAFLRAARVGRCAGPPYIRIGRAVRYFVADLDQWLRDCRVPRRTVEGRPCAR